MHIHLILSFATAFTAGTASAFTVYLLPPTSNRLSAPPHERIRTSTCTGGGGDLTSVVSLAAESGSGAGNVQRPKNEFSRRYRTDAVLGGGGARGSREYGISIEATEEERSSLASRFKLSEIAKLEADLVLRKDNSRGSAYGSDCIQAEGTVFATVTQTCVRTNEDFDVNLEFDIAAAVRPMGEKTIEDDLDMEEVERQLGDSGGGRKRGGRKGKRESRAFRGTDKSIGEMDMKSLQDLLQDFDVEEDVVEDEAVMGTDGFLDAGELVAQLFRLKLDPYPKKPGSKPINISFSG